MQHRKGPRHPEEGIMPARSWLSTDEFSLLFLDLQTIAVSNW